MDAEKLRRENAELRTRLGKLREKLPPPAMPEARQWLTIDQAAELLDTSAAEVERALEKMELHTDGNGRPCIRCDKFDSYVVAVAADERPERFF